MNRNQLLTPEGTKDYLYEEATLRRSVEQKLRETFEFRGYHEVVTPSLEFLDVFSHGHNSLPMEQMYKLTDSKGRLLVLRPDSTMPIARLCCTRLKNEPLPYRLCYHQPVFSSNPALRGHSNEQLQSGIELIGKSGRKADIEVLVTAIQALQALNIPNYRVEIGHIGIFKSLVDSLQATSEEKETIRQLIEEKNYPALGDLLDHMEPLETAQVIKRLPRLFGQSDVFLKAREYIREEQTLSYLSYLEELSGELSKLGILDKITFDLGIVNRNDYYTGIIFKGYVEGYGEEVLSGGRYDALLEDFGSPLHAIGFAVNIDAAVKALLPSVQNIPEQPPIFIYSDDDGEMKALEQIAHLSALKIKTEYVLCDSLDEALQYAKSRGGVRLDAVTGTAVQTFDLT
jgi:ATP phosphoribosyltransferase regulatory subunit